LIYTCAVIQYFDDSGELGANVVYEGSRKECNHFISSCDVIQQSQLDIIVLEKQSDLP